VRPRPLSPLTATPAHPGLEDWKWISNLQIVLENGRRRKIIEIKHTSSPAPEDLARLGQIAAMIDATHSTLICRIRKSILTADRVVANLPDYLDTIREE
jgi:hypothetical protein